MEKEANTVSRLSRGARGLEFRKGDPRFHERIALVRAFLLS